MTWLWTELGDKDIYLENWKFGMCVNYPSSLYVTQSTRQDLSNTLKSIENCSNSSIKYSNKKKYLVKWHRLNKITI